jgi:hypothetical protein
MILSNRFHLHIILLAKQNNHSILTLAKHIICKESNGIINNERINGMVAYYILSSYYCHY